jgi:hypothetical protein
MCSRLQKRAAAPQQLPAQGAAKGGFCRLRSPYRSRYLYRGNHLTTLPSAQANLSPVMSDGSGAAHEMGTSQHLLWSLFPRGLMKPSRTLAVKNVSHMLTIALFSAIAPALATEPSAADPDLVQFRQAYTTGSDLAYVVIKYLTDCKNPLVKSALPRTK